MSKYSSLPGYDPNQQTIYGDEEAHSLPEDDRDWKGMFSSFFFGMTNFLKKFFIKNFWT